MVAQPRTLIPRTMTLDKLVRLVHYDGWSSQDIALVACMQHIVDVRHDGDRRRSGGRYDTHLYCVQYCLSKLGTGAVCVAAGLGHDLVEHRKITVSELESELTRFEGGIRVARIIAALTKEGAGLPTLDPAQYHWQMLEAVVNGFWETAFVKLTDRGHNLVTLKGFNDTAKEYRYIEETTTMIYDLAEASRPEISNQVPNLLDAFDIIFSFVCGQVDKQRARLGVAAA